MRQPGSRCITFGGTVQAVSPKAKGKPELELDGPRMEPFLARVAEVKDGKRSVVDRVFVSLERVLEQVPRNCMLQMGEFALK
jgi:hypothetical protein